MGIKLYIKPLAIGFVRRGFAQKVLTKYAVNHKLSFQGVTLVLFKNVGGNFFSRQTLAVRGVSPVPVRLKLQFFLPGGENRLQKNRTPATAMVTKSRAPLTKNSFNTTNAITSSLQRTAVILQSTTLLQPVNTSLWIDAQSGFRPDHNRGQRIDTGGVPVQNFKVAGNIRYLHELERKAFLTGSSVVNVPRLPLTGAIVNHLVRENVYQLRETVTLGIGIQQTAGNKPYSLRIGGSTTLRRNDQGEAYLQKAASGLELAKPRLYALRGHGTADLSASNDQGGFYRDFAAPGLQLAKARSYVLQPRGPAAFSRTDQGETFYSHKSAPRMDLTKPRPLAGEPVVKGQKQVVTGAPSGQVAASRTVTPQVDVNRLANQVYQEIERRLKLERSRRGR